MGLPFLARALSHRDFRLFVAGQGVSLVGTWVQQAALGWLVYRLTGSAFWLGAVWFAGQVPVFFLASFAGVFTDRWSRRRLLLLTQSLALLQALLLGLLVVTGRVDVCDVLLLNLLLGLVNALDMTARQAFLADLVTRKEDLASAISLHSGLVNAARLLGPSLAGFVIARAGEGACFLLNSASYLAVIAALLALRVPPGKRAGPQRSFLREWREGLLYAFGSASIRSVLLLLALVSLAGMPYASLLPVFARDVLGSGPEGYGLLMGASGCGALGGAAFVASRRNVSGLGRQTALAAGTFGAALAGISCSRAGWLSWSLLLLGGFAWTVQLASSNTLLQTLAPEDRRGRVMSFYTTAFLGMAPWGHLLAGGLASLIGAPRTLLLGGLACVCGSLLLAGRLRRCEQETGRQGRWLQADSRGRSILADKRWKGA